VNIQAASSVATSSGFTSFIIGHLRHAQARINLASNEIAATLTAVRAGWLDGDGAVEHLHSMGLLDFVVRERSSQ